jgi:hypothetical protein
MIPDSHTPAVASPLGSATCCQVNLNGKAIQLYGLAHHVSDATTLVSFSFDDSTSPLPYSTDNHAVLIDSLQNETRAALGLPFVGDADTIIGGMSDSLWLLRIWILREKFRRGAETCNEHLVRAMREIHGPCSPIEILKPDAWQNNDTRISAQLGATDERRLNGILSAFSISVTDWADSWKNLIVD